MTPARNPKQKEYYIDVQEPNSASSAWGMQRGRQATELNGWRFVLAVSFGLQAKEELDGWRFVLAMSLRI